MIHRVHWVQAGMAVLALGAAGCHAGGQNGNSATSSTGHSSGTAVASASGSSIHTAATSSKTTTAALGTPVSSGPIFTARGLYATGWSAGSPKKLGELIDTIQKTGLNSIVIDVKDSDGAVSYYTPDVPLAVSIGACSKTPRDNRIPDLSAVMKRLKDAHIHTIARIVCFNDPILARKHPDFAVMKKGGGVWHGRKGTPWVDPTLPAAQQYVIDLAKDAIKQGFDEIQWDYVRFPSDGDTRQCVYHQPVDGHKALAIATFLKHAYQALESYHVPISADIFGLTGTAKSDMGIGQKINPIADNVDAISPMVYPSHFAHGEYHMQNPNTQPYKTVFYSLRDASRRISGSHAVIRPWLQAFSLFGVHYGPDQVLDQIRAVRDDHINQFLFWNANNRYDIVQAAFTSAAGRQLLQQLEQDRSTSPQQMAASPAAAGAGAAGTAHGA